MTTTDTTRTTPSAGAGGPRYRLNRRGKLVFTLLPIAILGLIWVSSRSGGSLTVSGLENEEILTAADSDATVVIESQAPLEDVSVTLDEDPVQVSAEDEGRYVATIADLSEGEHELTVAVAQPFPWGPLTDRRTFTVDTTPPGVDVLAPTGPVPLGEELLVRASVDDLSADVSFDGDSVEVDESGVVEVTYPDLPGSVTITATDPVGNESELVVPIEPALPGAPGAPPMFGVHATGWTWATPELKDPIMQMIDDGLINTVQLDLKDEGGDIWYDTGVQLAHDMGAVTVLYDLAEAVEEIHDKGARVVGRIVNFRDPRMATYAVDSGNMSWVVQNPDGSAYGQYGGFTNPFDPEVREYNTAIAEEAARLGVDDIMFDYVRRPDTLSELVYPGQDGDPEDAIVGFLAESYERVRGAGARLGAAVFGIAATRPHEVAQDIPRMAQEVDYIAPMVYPSHWGPGEYGVDDPNSQPYDITFRSLEEFVEITDGTQSHVVAWLQDFSLGIEYGPAEVRAQIDAARDAGVDNILLWDAATTYTTGALDPLE